MTRMPRVDSLTGIRAVAAMVVFAYHASLFFKNSSRFELVSDLTRQGSCGVSLFFILSGFVLAWTNGGSHLLASAFWRKRFARLAPVYFVCAATSLPIIFFEHPEQRLEFIGLGLFTLTALQSWIPLHDWYLAGNGVSWSISTEAFFYAMFPILAAGLVARVSRRGVGALCVLCVITVLLIPIALHPSDAAVETSGSWRSWAIYIFPPMRFPEFVLGACLATWMRMGGRIRVPVSVALTLSVIAYLVAGQVSRSLAIAAITAVPFALTIGALAQRELDGRPGGPLARPPMVTAGTWSYAFYMVHQLVLRVLALLLGVGHVAVAWKALALLAALAAAWLLAGALSHFVEAPAERIIRRSAPRVESSSQ